MFRGEVKILYSTVPPCLRPAQHFYCPLRMAGYLSSRQGAGAQEYGLYFKLLQRSIGGRDPAYAVAFDRCNGRYPSCSSQAAREWYRPHGRQGAFSRDAPLFGRGNTASSPSSLFDGNKYSPFPAPCQSPKKRFHRTHYHPLGVSK